MYRNRKTTLIMAIVAAIALVMTGTFAWVMTKDDTRLNNLIYQGSVPTDLQVRLNEVFDTTDPGGKAWDEKKVWVENHSTEDVIIRVRFEESLSITSSRQTALNTAAGSPLKNIFATNSGFGIASGKVALSNVEKDVIFYLLGDNVITMDQWINSYNMAMEHNGKPLWVIDTDGWCYYTDYLYHAPTEGGDGESSELLLKQIYKEDSRIVNKHGQNVILDYWVNVRLQAMTADLSSYGSEVDAEQWTYSSGRQIVHQINPLKEIYTTSKITNNANTLVRKVNEIWLAANPLTSSLNLKVKEDEQEKEDIEDNTLEDNSENNQGENQDEGENHNGGDNKNQEETSNSGQGQNQGEGTSQGEGASQGEEVSQGEGASQSEGASQDNTDPNSQENQGG